jgi:tetratricopeptide (TPR) repeat protein
MTLTARHIVLLLIVLLLPGIWSCAQIKERVSPQKGTETPPAPAEETLRPSVDESVRAPIPAADLARREMDAGRYQKALDLYDMAHRSAPQDRQLLQNYTASVEKIRSVARQAMDQQDCVSAGRNYHLLLKNYSTFQGLGGTLSFEAADLDENLSNCKKCIAKQGFEAYRNGDLDEAIALWEALLEIDPDNAEIRDALRIARMQQKNLQE